MSRHEWWRSAREVTAARNEPWWQRVREGTGSRATIPADADQATLDAARDLGIISQRDYDSGTSRINDAWLDSLFGGGGAVGGGGFGGGGGPSQAEIDIANRGLDIRWQEATAGATASLRDRQLAEKLGMRGLDVDQSRIDLDRMLGVGEQSQSLFFGLQDVALQGRGFDIQELLAGNQLSFDRQQLAEDILLARDQMAQSGSFQQQEIDLEVERMMRDAGFTQQDLDIASDRLALDRELGTRGMDLEEIFGLGDLALRREDLDLRRTQGGARLDLDRELGFGRFAVEREIAGGTLGLGNRQLDLDRLLGTGELELGRSRLGLQREQFVEEQVMNQAALSANPRRVFEAAFAQAGRDPTAGSELLQSFIDF